MELGDEVSIKIKSAIRARLKELGIVWDRELPDYVMVLIANKKSKEQMENDLMIFLGSHTAGFTAWLHNVLKKLEECTISRGLTTKRRDEEKKIKSKRRPSDENCQETKKLKGIDQKSEDNVNSSSDAESELPSNQLSPVRIDEGMDSDVSDFSAPTLAMSDMKLNSSVNAPESNERLGIVSNNEVGRRAEVLEIHDKLIQEPTPHVEEKPKPKEKIEINWNNEKNSKSNEHSPKERKGSYHPRRNSLKSRDERRRSRSKSRSRVNQQDFDEEKLILLGKRGMKENIHKEQERKGFRISRNMFRRRDCEERRNGYGIKSRPIGKSRSEKDRTLRNRSSSMDVDEDRLPSLVKVTPRPVRPPSMQPSSNLILKAVAEAQKSIATSSLPQPDDKLQKKEEKDSISRKAVYRKKNIPVFQRENISVTLLNDRVIADKIRDEHEDSPMFDNNARKQENQLNDGPEVERFTISLLSDDNDSLVASDFEETNEHKGLGEENYIETDQSVTQDEQMDISTTACAGDSVEENEMREFSAQRFDRRRLGPRVVPDADTVLSFQNFSRKSPEEKKLSRSLLTCRACSRIILPGRGLAPAEDSIKKTIVNENAYASNDSKLDENGKVIKCKFWPSCEAGNDCRFYHPKEYCRTLPNCKFGQKCLFYHPPCKFADKCLNVTCPYTHTPVTVVAPTVKAKVWTKVPLAPSNGQICMYYPNCKKPFCPYQHSYSAATGIPCKFGINCTKVGCEFDHTQLAKNPYKWVAQNPE